MSLLNIYQETVKRDKLQPDMAQMQAVDVLQRIQDELATIPRKKTITATVRKPGFLGRLFGTEPQHEPVHHVRGAYIWGGVGRGKTWLMDLFFEQVPLQEKRRMHYHHFMKYVHDELALLHDQPNPLDEVVKRMAQDTRLLCIDEFHVLDIVDAMILHGLLDAMAKYGITLVTTSNRIPDDLYSQGLQRARFLPAIAILKRDTEVLELDNKVDYRMLKQVGDNRFLDDMPDSAHELSQQFTQLALGKVYTNALMNIQGRRIPVLKMADNIAWFSFEALCDGPRSTRDYIDIAERYAIIMLSNMPELNHYNENAARRFLNLIDELYDRQVRLILSSDVALDQLYQGDKLVFEYDRAMSRLNEMQSDEYQQFNAA